MANNVKKHRLQFDFTPEALLELDNLKNETGLHTRAELIRHSLRLMQWALNETQSGGKLLIEKNGVLRENIFPFWNLGANRS